MVQVSKRGNLMQASPIRKLVLYAEEAKKRGIKVYHLNIGQPDIETPKPMMDAVRNCNFKVLKYSHSAGRESYRKKLVEYYSRVGINVHYNQIVVTMGASEAIFFAMMSCMDEKDEILIPEPFYANYSNYAFEADVKVVSVTSSIENGFALPSIKEFENKISPRTKAIFICNPNNPTGYLYTRDEMEALKQLALKHNLFLFSDEAYREFCYEGTHVSAMHLTGIDDNVILIDSISKRYSACGGRIGALITKNQKVLDNVMKFAQARLSPPTFAQLAGEAAVDLPADYFDKTKAEYISRRNLLVKRLNEMEGVYCPMPSGAFYATAKLPVDDADVFCQWLLEKFNYHNQTVMLAPASGFYNTPGLGKKEARFAYVINQTDINAAMNCLQEALKQYPERTL